jgi:hypothetical protein
MPREQRFHVVPHDGAWAVRKPTGKSFWVFETKSAAIDEAHKRARGQNSGTRVVVHGKSGQIIQNTSVKSDLSEKQLREAVRGVDKAKQSVVKQTRSTKVTRAKKR